MLQMAMWDCIDKARDIQNKMVELKANVPGIDVGASPATNGEAEREARHRHPWHNMLRNATKKYRRDLELKDCQDRTDQEGKDCEKQLDDLMISKEAIEVDSVGVNVSQHTKNTFEAELHDAIDMGTNKSTAEIKLDKDSKKPTVKSIVLILIAAQKFKNLLIKKKIKEGKADIDDQSSSTQVHLLYAVP